MLDISKDSCSTVSVAWYISCENEHSIPITCAENGVRRYLALGQTSFIVRPSDLLALDYAAVEHNNHNKNFLFIVSCCMKPLAVNSAPVLAHDGLRGTLILATEHKEKR